jgi:hypothetical protein
MTNRFPASKVAAPDTSTTSRSSSRPDRRWGAYSLNQFTSWDQKTDPEVAAYLKAMEGSSTDPRNATAIWGYAAVMWFYTAARQIGFERFDAASLAQFMSTKNDVHIPLSRSVVNPGPATGPQQKQPYVQIAQWKDGKMTVVAAGDEGDGWVLGY